MKREFSPIHLALLLILSCVVFRLLSSVFPEYIPNISPLMAIAFVGAMYLPGRWGWLVGPATLIFTDLAFLQVNYRTDGSMFSWWSVVSLGVYALAGGLGVWIASRKSLVKIISGSIGCSLLFYVAANTFSWWNNLYMKMTPAYPPTLEGLWQANTVGLPGYLPTWLFLRNGIAGDLFFALLLLLMLDRALLLGQAPAKAMPRAV
ncbi:MAG TPA: DUF6580 family putative transport protein [Candidatus Methylacidiphilales bacterium]